MAIVFGSERSGEALMRQNRFMRSWHSEIMRCAFLAPSEAWQAWDACHCGFLTLYLDSSFVFLSYKNILNRDLFSYLKCYVVVKRETFSSALTHGNWHYWIHLKVMFKIISEEVCNMKLLHSFIFLSYFSIFTSESLLLSTVFNSEKLHNQSLVLFCYSISFTSCKTACLKVKLAFSCNTAETLIVDSMSSFHSIDDLVDDLVVFLLLKRKVVDTQKPRRAS